MAVIEQVPEATAVADGATLVFPYGFLIPTVDDLVVEIDAVRQFGGFSVSGLGLGAGNVTFSAAPIEGANVVIRRSTRLIRPIDYQTLGDFQAKVVNLDFDRQVLALQEMRLAIDNVLVGAVTAARVVAALGYLPPSFPQVNAAINAAVVALPDGSAELSLNLADTSTGKGASLVKWTNDLLPLNTVASKLSAIVSPTDAPWNAKGDGITDDTAAVQACIDANPTSRIDFGDGRRHYKLTRITLTDTTHDFQGQLTGDGAVLTFTNAGVYTDLDAAMQHGFECYPHGGNFASGSFGSEVSGWRGGVVRGLTINCPANGAGFYLANCQRVSFEKVNFVGGRYGTATECCIHTTHDHCSFQDQFNAGIGWINSGDQARVNYGSGDATTAYWNDSPAVYNCGFASGLFGGLSFILDHGSTSESVRDIRGNYFYSGDGGRTQYGYLGRGGNPVIEGANWFENVNFPIFVMSTNASSGGFATNLPGVTNSQPNGTYGYFLVPDNFSYTASIRGNYFANCNVDIDVSGVTGGPTTIGSNLSQGCNGFHLRSTQSGGQLVLDLGDAVINTRTGFAGYKSMTYGKYVSLGRGAADGSDAPAGAIGEYLSAQVLSTSGVGLSSAAIANVASIVLTPGDWDVSGAVGFNPNSAASLTWVAGALTPTSAAFGNERDTFSFNTPTATAAVNQKGNVGPSRFNVTINTTIYLIAQAQFSGGSCAAYGTISARRIR